MSLVPAVTELILAELLYLQFEDQKKPIYMYINSTGTTKASCDSWSCQPGSALARLSHAGVLVSFSDDVTAVPAVNRCASCLSPSTPARSHAIFPDGPMQDGKKLGYDTEAFAIYDTMLYVKPPIHTICVGTAWGEAAMLLASGAKVSCRRQKPAPTISPAPAVSGHHLSPSACQ